MQVVPVLLGNARPGQMVLDHIKYQAEQGTEMKSVGCISPCPLHQNRPPSSALSTHSDFPQWWTMIRNYKTNNQTKIPFFTHKNKNVRNFSNALYICKRFLQLEKLETSHLYLPWEMQIVKGTDSIFISWIFIFVFFCFVF